MTELAIFTSVGAAYFVFLTCTTTLFVMGRGSAGIAPVARARISRMSFPHTNS